MSARATAVYWLFVLVPAVAIAAGAAYLLRHEQERIEGQARAAARDRARSIAEAIEGAVAEVEAGLTQSLRTIPPAEPEKVLAGWEEANPLIRNAFVWDPAAGLVHPPALGRTSEEVRFATRYEALFSGRVPWRAAERDAVPGASEPAAPLRAGTRELVQLAQQPGGIDAVETAGRGGLASGWIPWFAENQLFLLGWVAGVAADRVCGVELEMAALLSRLIAVFPAEAAPGWVYGLIDGNGALLYQTGGPLVPDPAAPELAVPLAPLLPHWQVGVYAAAAAESASGGRGFVLLGGLLLCVLVVTIGVGAALLLAETRRSQRDARRKTSFVANVSHELKTPLTSIRMYAELLAHGRVTEPERRRHCLDLIVAESLRLTRLVNNVLEFGRLEEGRRRYNCATIELDAWLREVADRQRERIEAAGLALDVRCPHDPAPARADAEALEQALLNLIDNAVKYAAEGKELVLELASDARRAELRVLDRGPGVPPGHRDRIFEKFHRADDSLTAARSGTGLGLSIARGLVRGMGGELRFEPRPGGGSCFVIALPRERRA